MSVKEKLVELLEAIPHATRLYPDLYVDELIANGVTVQEWISVEDRLPKDGECVLIWCGSYEEIGWYDADDKVWRSDYVNDYEGDVTHWMPLPQPPKGE